MISKFFTWWAKSFSSSGDVSARRLTAFDVTMIYTAARVSFFMKVTDPYYLWLALVVDALFILLLFGIITMQQITELKNGTVIQKTETKIETSSETKTEETKS